MPQMKPMLWMYLLILFSSLMIMFIINNFFNILFYKNNLIMINKKNKFLYIKNNWMW